MNKIVLRTCVSLLLSTGFAYAGEDGKHDDCDKETIATARVLVQQRHSVTRHELFRWLEQHGLEKHFTKENVILPPVADGVQQSILLNVPEEAWTRWQAALVQSKPSLKAYVAAGALGLSTSLGALFGIVSYNDIGKPGRPHPAVIVPLTTLLGGLAGAFAGMNCYQDSQRDFATRSLQIARVAKIEEERQIPRGRVLLELCGLQKVFSDNRISDISKVLENIWQQEAKKSAEASKQ